MTSGTSGKVWSVQQRAIFEEFKSGTSKVVVVEARAGTGKTTTILEALDYAPEAEIVCCAFNKDIAEELKHRIKNPRAQAKTLHSLGNSYVYARWGRTQIDGTRGLRLAEKAIPQRDAPRDFVRLVANIASKAKGIAPMATNPAPLVEIAVDFDLLPDEDMVNDQEEPYTVEEAAAFAYKAMEAATVNSDNTIDFDDMIFLPLRNRWVRPKFDLVVVDEAQDMNAAQLMLAQLSCRGRLVIVGDPRQGIYGFRGADTASFERFKTELHGKVLPLTVTYRCPKRVVAEAKTIVPDYEAAPTAPEGIVRGLGSKSLVAEAAPTNFILSRSNAPLVTVCLKLLRSGKRAIVRGKKDVGLGLLKLVEKLKARDLGGLMGKLDKWEEKTLKMLRSQKKVSESAVEFVADQAQTIRELSEGLTSMGELKARMETLFSDNDVGNSVVCSSVHKAKGLEAEKVFVLASTLYPGKRHDIEEENIHYVAVTRAKAELVLVEGKEF